MKPLMDRIRSVHWQNDMLVDERHFRHEQQYMESLFGWGLTRSWGVYGLVRPEPGEPALRIQVEKVSSGDNTIRVTVRQCVALSPDGVRIFIRDGDTGVPTLEHEYRLDMLEGRYDVFVSVDSVATPLRAGQLGEVPLAAPRFALNVERHREGLLESPGQVKIAEIIQARSGDVQEDEFYIPPCTGMLCTKALQSKAEEILDHFKKIQSRSLLIGVTELNEAAIQEGRISEDDAQVFRFMCEKLAIWLGSNIDQLEIAIRQNRPPVTLFTFCKQFFRLFDTILGVQGERGRTSLHDTWKKWNADFQNYEEFNAQLRTLLVSEYEHASLNLFINKAFSLLQPFAQTLSRVHDLLQTQGASPPKPKAPKGIRVRRRGSKNERQY